MTKLNFKSTVLPWSLFILVALINNTSGCSHRGDKNTREHKPKPKYHYHFNDPRHREYLPVNYKHRIIVPAEKLLIPEYELTVPKTSCQKTLCANVPNYPLEEINRAIDRARNTLRPGGTIIAFQNKGITFKNFTSQYDTFWFGERVPDHRFVDQTNDCKEHVNTFYPQEGYSSNDGKIYYIINVPTMYRGLTKMQCESRGQMCTNDNDLSAATRLCRQMYREEQLLALPTGKSYFDVEDFELQSFYVPTGCACISSP